MLRKQKTRAWLLMVAALVLLIISGQNLFAQFDLPLVLKWEVENIGENSEQFAVAPDETIFVATHQKDSNATIRVYDLTNGSLLRQFPAPFCWKNIVFMSDSRHLAITGASCPDNVYDQRGKIKIMDLENGFITDSIDFPDSLKNEIANDISVSQNGKYLAVCIIEYSSLKTHYVIFNTNDWSINSHIFLSNGAPYKSAFSPDSKYFFFNEFKDNFNVKNYFKMLNMETKYITTIHIADNSITDIKFSKDSTKMLFARERKLLGIYHFIDSSLDTINIDKKFNYVDRNIELISNNHILFTSSLGIRILNMESTQLFLITNNRAGSITLLKNNNSFFYASDVYAGVVTGLDKIVSSVKIEKNTEMVYPNPTTREINLSKLEFKSGNLKIIIADINGKEIKLLFNGYYEQQNLVFNIGDLSNGTYLLKIQNANEVKTQKIIVAN